MKALILALALTAQPWSLQDCINWALEHNLTVAGQELNRESADVDRNTAQMSWLPNLNASVSQNVNFGRGIGGNNTYEYGNSASTGFSLGSSMTLFDGLATPNRIKLARLNLDAATQDLEKAKDDIRVSVAKAYVQILYDYEIRDVAAQQVAIDSMQVERLESMVAVGRASKADLSQQKASLAQSRVTFVQADNSVRSSLLDMAQLLELPSWEDFAIVRTDTAVPSDYDVIGTPDDIYEDAVMSRPAVRAEQLRLEGSDYSVKIAKSGYYPSLSLSGGIGTNYYSSFPNVSFFNQLRANFSQYVGLTLSIPIFNNFKVRNQVRSAQIQKSTQELQLRRVEHTLYKDICQAWDGAVAARAKYEASLDAESAAADAFELIEAKYEAGAATITEFSESRTRYMKAKSDLVQASCEYLFQTALVKFYRGADITL